jgi:hypothetical protein
MKYKLTLLALLFSSYALAQPNQPSLPNPGGNAGYQGTTSATGGLGAEKPSGTQAVPTQQGSSSKSGSSLKSSNGSGHYNPADCKTDGGRNVC